MRLVIAEKPSVGQSLAKVIGATKSGDGYLEGNGFIVSWCVGHLVELAEPQAYDERYEKWRKEDLPIQPDSWKYRVSPATRKQFGILKELMNREDVESLIEATDAGREGELIFRLVYNQANCRKPFERLWISSMEDEAIREGFENLKPGEDYDDLYKAALCRERADWIVGINATRLFSTIYGQTLNVGRVMTPTLALAVEREASIRAFKPEKFYTVLLMADGISMTSERIPKKEDAVALEKKCRESGKATVTKLEKKERQENSPALYDLTTLQRDANKRLGYTAQQTLDYTQSLYEKKLCSYPRTDSRYLTPDMASTVENLLTKVESVYGIRSTEEYSIEKVINGKKVTDHHAIIPTGQIAEADLSLLPRGEQAVLKLLCQRLAEGVSVNHRFYETVLEAECAGATFKAKGKAVIDPGWKAIAAKQESEEGNSDDSAICIDVSEGEDIVFSETKCKEGQTTPPKSFTEDTLLSAMEKAGAEDTPDEAERKGLGTPATRAGIIEKLVSVGFIERKGDKKTKYLIPTHKGESLINVVPESIQSASMTAEWEQKLLEIEKQNFEAEEFMEEIEEMVSNLVETYEPVEGADVLMHPVYEPVGVCPCCGKSVVEKSKGFFCEDNACKFALWKENRFFDSLSKKITKPVAEKLLSNGKAKLKGCKSQKTGKTYDCNVKMSVNEVGYPQFALEFEKKRSYER